MPPVFSKVQQKKLHGQSREIVYNVLTFFEEEAKQWNDADPSFLIPVKRCQDRCSQATGVSTRTLQRIKKEGNRLSNRTTDETCFSTPDKKRVGKKRVTDFDEFDKTVIRRTVHDFYVTEKCVPTIEKIRLKLGEAIGYTGSSSSLRTVLRDLGFRWRRTRNNRKVLIEREDMRNKRIDFIRQVRKYRAEGRPIVYTDESYVVTNHSTPNSWQDTTNGGLHVPVGSGDRLIIVHAGGEDGFVPHAFLQWKARQSTGDYHKNMNQKNYEKWVQEKLLPNLKPRSVLIIDNASYHNVKANKVPTKSSLKVEMQDWLKNHNVDFTANMFKSELFELIQKHKPPTIFCLDEIVKNKGHSILRLPPYHPDLNSIELIWSQIKGYVAQHNTDFTMKSVIGLVERKVSQIGATEWKKCCEHVKNIETQYLEREGIIDDFHDSIIINVGESDSDESEDEHWTTDEEQEENIMHLGIVPI